MNLSENARRFLMEIDQCHSISKAAIQLYVTQPYISQTIHKMEKDLGISLIQHQGTGTQLTYAGHRLLEYLKDQKQNYTRMRHEMTMLAQYQSGVLRLGMNQPCGRYLLPVILPKFSAAYPNLRVVLQEIATDKGAYLLENDQLDVFYGMYIKKKVLRYVPVAHEPYFIVASGQSELVNDKTVGHINLLEDARFLNGQKLVTIPADSKFQQQVEDYLVKEHVDIQRLVTVPDLDLAANLMLHQTGITFSIQSTLQRQGLFNNPKVAIFQIPTHVMQIDSGISFKSTDNPAINLMISLLMSELGKEMRQMPTVL